MTAFDGLDLVDARVVGAIDEIAAATRPDYLDDIFKVTATTRQRPRWTFRARWLSIDGDPRTASRRGLPLRPLVIVVVLALLACLATAVFVGSQRRVPPPFGPAGNGQLVYGSDGDLYVRDSLIAAPRLLVGGPGEQGGALSSPDGQLIAYDDLDGNVDYLAVVAADGSYPRRVIDAPFVGGTAAWSPDSHFLALTNSEGFISRSLMIVAIDGSGVQVVPLDQITPWEAIFNPANDGTLLIRGDDEKGDMDLYLIDQTGRVLRKYHRPGKMLYGFDWELSGITFSPDGRSIAHNSVEEGPIGAVFRTYVIDVDGSNPRLLREPPDAAPDYSQAWPVFSPDGKSILMESWVGIPGGPSTNQLAIAPADGSAPPRGIGPKLENQSLVKVWSPDGTMVLMAARDINELYSIDPVTGTHTKLPWSSDLPDIQRTLR